MSESEVLSRITELAPKVAALHEDRTAAVAEETEAEAAVLTTVVEMVRPALRALRSRIEKQYASTSGRNGCNPVTEESWFPERGVLLVDNFYRERDETGNRGRFRGERLYLLDDGRFAEVKRRGQWSHWQGEWDRWTAEMVFLSVEQVSRKYELPDVLKELADALEQQATGASAQRATKARERAVRLRAIAALTK